MKPHRIQDRHGVEICSCGYWPGTYTEYSRAEALRVHVREMDDHLCHYEKYKMECLLPKGHSGIHISPGVDGANHHGDTS